MAFPTGYTKYQEITVQASKVSADLTDYVIYVDLSDLDLASADIFDTARADGGDIRVTKSDGTTQLPREVVSFDVANKKGELHIKYSGVLSSTTNTVIRIWYNGVDTEPAATSTYGSQAVWSNYKLVVHMNDVVKNSVDDTTLTENATETTTAKIGQEAQSFGGKKITLPDVIGISNSGVGVTYTAWVRTTSNGTDQRALAYTNSSGSGYQHAILWVNQGAANQLSTYWNFSTGVNNPSTSVTTLNTWNKLTASADSTGTMDSYANGVQFNSVSVGAFLGNSVVGKYVGSSRTGSSSYFYGEIDELRISKTKITASWEGTEYNNQNSPSTFYSVGAEQGGGGGGDLTVNVNDSPTITESVIASVTSFLFATEVPTLSEDVSVTRSENIIISVQDSPVISEQASPVLVSNISAQEAPSVSGNINLVAIPQINVLESATLSESVVRVASITLSLTDEIPPTENISLVGTLFISVFDTASSNEQIVNTGSITQQVNESVAIQESVELTKIIVLEVNDSSLVTESIQRLGALFIETAETPSISELATSISGLIIFSEENLVISEDIVNTSSIAASVAEGAVVTENVLFDVITALFIADTGNINEATQRTLIHGVNIYETTLPSESIGSFTAIGNAVYDTPPIQENISSSSQSVALVVEVATTEEVVAIVGAFFLEIQDTQSISENVSTESLRQSIAFPWDHPRGKAEKLPELTVSGSI